MLKKLTFCILIAFALPFTVKAQITIGGNDSVDYAHPKEYTIAGGGIEIIGTKTLDKKVIKYTSGLYEGMKIKIPSDATSDAIKKLWKQNFFDDIKINITKIVGDEVFLSIELQEKPRLSNGISFKRSKSFVKKGEAEDINGKLRLLKGKIVTDYILGNVKNVVRAYYIDKGFYNVKVDVVPEVDPKAKYGEVNVFVNVDKGKKVKIEELDFVGNTVVKSWKLRKKMKETKRYRWWNVFNNGKYLEENYESDKPKILEKYNALGYRDARIAKDTMYFVAPNRVKLEITVDEGHQYHFGNITWVGNTKYRSGQLDTILAIKKGDVFDQSVLDQKLFMNPNGFDVSSLYMDDGYLFFQLNPVEVNVQNDSIDLEVRIYEGKQAIINRVTVIGNTKTNDHVIMREIRTRPGQLFRRSDIMRTQRELSQLGYFDPEKMGVTPTPNATDGTVDIEYKVEEKPSDQVELSGGWGGGRVVGTLGVTFNNFSARNFFKRGAWTPLPSGDGQRLSIRAQSTGVYYQSYNMSFTEPWLGGKKPNSLSLSIFHNVQTNGQTKKIKIDGKKVDNPNRADINISGVSVGFGKRLKKPDDWFSLYAEEYLGRYNLNNYYSVFTFGNGIANNFKTTINISRNSLQGNPIFPTGGSNMTLIAAVTPPYSLLNHKDYSTLKDQEKYRFVEYQKYKFTTQWFMQLTNKKAAEGKEARNLVLRTSMGFGILGSYNKAVGTAPFERFYLGGSGLTGFALDGREIIALRGYDDNSISGADGKGCSVIS
ncbi:MAG: outer membrane protein assembly factor, partial [Bacteroidia bacterium]